MMRVTKLTFIAHELNAALGSGRFHDISYDDIWRHIEDGTIFRFLSERLGLGVPLSVLDPMDRTELLLQWENMRTCVEPFRYDGHRSGICLLVGYLLRGITSPACDPRYSMLPNDRKFLGPDDRGVAT
jgi:hypothetical protein